MSRVTLIKVIHNYFLLHCMHRQGGIRRALTMQNAEANREIAYIDKEDDASCPCCNKWNLNVVPGDYKCQVCSVPLTFVYSPSAANETPVVQSVAV